MPSTVSISTKNRVGLITLNLPDSRNALDEILINELTDGLSQFARSQEVRVVILTGSGRAFCAGMNFEYLERSINRANQENFEDAKALMKLLQLIRNHKKIVIGMVNGPAMGGGCGLAAACDFVFAGKEKAKFGVPEVGLGFVPAVILDFLVKRMGEGRAREFVLQCGVFDADRAKEAGLVTEVIPDEQLSTRTFEFAESLCDSTSPSSVTLTKELFSRFDEMNKKDAIEFAINLNALVRKTEDFKRGMDSISKKEKIKW